MIYLFKLIMYHTRPITIGILCIGGMVSFGVLYSVLSSPSKSADISSNSGAIVATDDAFSRFSSWVDSKEKTKNQLPQISSSVFFVPASL